MKMTALPAQNRSQLGIYGQDCVEKFLHRQGYRLLAKNYHARLGELDLVMAKDELVCFVEVKTRSTKYLPLSASVNWTKQQRIAKTAMLFAIKNQLTDRVLRFDVATVFVSPVVAPEIEYLPNAFNAAF